MNVFALVSVCAPVLVCARLGIYRILGAVITQGREFESSLLEAIEVRARGGREGPNIESCWLGSETVFN